MPVGKSTIIASLHGFSVGVMIGSAVADQRRGEHLQPGWLQDRIPVRHWPGREHLAEVSVTRVLKCGGLAVTFGEQTGEGTVPGGQVRDPLIGFTRRFLGIAPEIVVLGLHW
jgi:hypothetical protein